MCGENFVKINDLDTRVEFSGLIVTNNKGAITSVNQEILDLTESKLEDLCGHDLKSLFQQPTSLQDLIASDDLPKHTVQELLYKRKGNNNKSNRLRLKISPVESLKEKEKQYIIHVSEVNPLGLNPKEGDNDQEFAQMKNMAANIAHEIRNPLGSIELFSSLLKQQLETESSRNLIDHISSAIQSMNHIISNLLEYTHPRPFSSKPVDLHAFLKKSLHFTQQLVETNDVKIITDWSAKNPVIFAEEGLLKQVFNNILINAMQAILDPGNISITTRNISPNADEAGISEKLNMHLKKPDPCPEWIEVSICDTGMGIPAEAESRIFDPFFTTKERGTGLGLTIVQNILESHGATIELKNTTEQGAHFVLYFPVLEKKAQHL